METKHCRTCNEHKPISDFRKHWKRKDNLQSQCQACFSLYYKEWYQQNKAKHKAAVSARNRQTKEANYAWIEAYLKTHPCVDCGEADTVVLEFDHVRGKKAHHMSRLIAGAGSMKTIQQELAKCVVRCANCHRRRTANRFTIRNKFR